MRGALVVHHLLLQNMLRTHIVILSILVHLLIHYTVFGITQIRRAEFLLGRLDSAKSIFVMRHIAYKNVSPIVDMFIR